VKDLQYKRSLFFWVIDPHQRATADRRFEKWLSAFQGWVYPVKIYHNICRPLKLRPIGCPKRRTVITHWGGAISQKDGDANYSSPKAYQPAVIEEQVEMGKSW